MAGAATTDSTQRAAAPSAVPARDAYAEYVELLEQTRHTEQFAGRMLAKSLTEGRARPEVDRRLAEDAAREVIELQARLKAWRLQHRPDADNTGTAQHPDAGEGQG